MLIQYTGTVSYEEYPDTSFRSLWQPGQVQDVYGARLSALLATSKLRSVDISAYETISVKEFGAVGDGVTDDSAAIQSALNHVHGVGGGVVYLPPGRYRKADTSANLTMYSNTTIRGSGDSSVIFFDDRDTNPRNDMLNANNTVNIAFEDFKIEGTLSTYTNETNQSQTLTGSNITGLRMSNVTITGVRFMATAFINVVDGEVIGCRFADIMRDGIRFTQSRNIRVIGNSITRVADDSIALHSIDSSASPLAAGFVVTGNTIEASQGIKILGAKMAIVAGNTLARTLRTPIEISSNIDPAEGSTPMFNINVSNNTITDTFGNRGSSFCIRLSILNRAKDVLASQPGAVSQIFDYTYLNNIDAGGVSIGAFGINISNNIISWTLPRGVNYSSYGYGQILDRNIIVGYSDPAITDASYCCSGIIVNGPVRALRICDNIFTGGSRNGTTVFPAIWLYSDNSAANTIVTADVDIKDNVISDWIGQVAVVLDHPTINGARNANITGNTFDLDPFFRHPDHDPATNKWTTTDSLAAIDTKGLVYAGAMTNNHFKNVSRPFLLGSQFLLNFDNYAYFRPSGTGSGLDGDANNQGIRLVNSTPRTLCVVIDGNPASATFGAIDTLPSKFASAMPTSGYYVTGHVVQASVPIIAGTAGSQYSVTGWQRKTTGTAHVLNTDWTELRCPTGT